MLQFPPRSRASNSSSTCVLEHFNVKNTIQPVHHSSQKVAIIVDTALKALLPDSAGLQPVRALQASETLILVQSLHAEKTCHKVPSGLRWWL